MKKIPMLLAVASLGVVTLSGCETGTSYRSAPSNPTPLPGIARQVGPSSPNAPRPPAAVPTAGPLTKAGVEKYMDGQEAALRKRLPGIRIARRGDDFLVTLPDSRVFGGEGLSPAGRALLENLSLVLRTYDRTHVDVNAYTDTTGGANRNLVLSQKRATLVADVLKDDGVASARLAARGLGEANLRIATGEGVSEPRNRRIEIRIVPRPD